MLREPSQARPPISTIRRTRRDRRTTCEDFDYHINQHLLLLGNTVSHA